MIAKRFILVEYVNKGLFIQDNANDKTQYFQGSKTSLEKVVDLLNEQHETIERLKQNIDELLSVNVEEALLKENEQLKSQILNVEEDRDYYKSKSSSLEEGYLQLQDREIRLEKENEQLTSEINMLKITIARNEAYIERITHKGEWSNTSNEEKEEVIAYLQAYHQGDVKEIRKYDSDEIE